MGVKEGEDYKDLGSMEPYAIAILAGLISKGIEVRFFDDRLDTIDYDEKTDLVAISVETFTAKRSYRIAQRYRDRGVPVIMGGFHPSLVPYESIQYADSVIIGEAEPVMEKVIEDFETGQLKRFYNTGFNCDMSQYTPNRTIFKNKRYIPITLTHFSRGCPYACSYCPDAVLYQGKIRFRPVKEVIKELEREQSRFVFFVDNNITCHKEKLKQLLMELAPLKIKWISQADINIAQDADLLRLMRQSGCFGLVVGFESLSLGNLKQMNKKMNIPLLSKYGELVRRIHDSGIGMWAAFLLGYDHDTKDTVKATLDFALKHRFFFAAFNHLIPYYGTPIYEYFRKEKRLLFDKWWLDPNYRFGQAVFRPKNMSHQELTDECLNARLAYNKYSNILRRATNFNANTRNLGKLGWFFKYTYLFKQEIKNKQNLVLN